MYIIPFYLKKYFIYIIKLFLLFDAFILKKDTWNYQGNLLGIKILEGEGGGWEREMGWKWLQFII